MRTSAALAAVVATAAFALTGCAHHKADPAPTTVTPTVRPTTPPPTHTAPPTTPTSTPTPSSTPTETATEPPGRGNG